MKKGLIIFLVFAVVLVIGLWFIAEVKANEVNTKLTIDSANTSVVVKDSTGQQMSNNSNLVLNATYTLVVMPDENYELKVLTLNEEDILPNLVDNTYSFVCNGAITIKIASALISSGEIPDIPTEYLSFNYLGSIIVHKNLFGLGGVTTGVLNIYDNELTLLATLEAGQSYEYILPGNTYSVEFERLSGWGFAWLQSRLVNSGSFEPTAYKNGETFENVLHSLDFRVEYHGGYSSTSYVGNAISITDINDNEVFDLTVGETYTINDITPDGYKVELKQNDQELILPYTFVYTEDLMFEIDVIEIATISVVSNVEGCVVEYAEIYEYNTYSAKTLVDENTEFEVGKEYFFFLEAPENYYLVEFYFWVSDTDAYREFSETYISNGQGTGHLFETNSMEIRLTCMPNVTPTITGENVTVIFTDALGEETNILVCGQTYTATITPDEGWSVESVTLNQNVIDCTQPYTFTMPENCDFVITTIQTTVTPNVTINGYDAEFSNIGVIKYRTDYSSANYIYDNLAFGESYYIQVDIYLESATYYYVSAIYVNDTLLGEGDSSTSSIEVGKFEVTEPLNVVIEIARK